jgi:hypothetical protein
MPESVAPAPLDCWITTRVQFRSRVSWPAAKRADSARSVPLLFFVEGLHDAEFLKRISLILQKVDSRLPDLSQSEKTQELIFIPTGGNPACWITRLSALRLPEVHLIDGESPPTTQTRQQVAAEINERMSCRAFVTQHRSLENYLHPAAIDDAIGLRVEFSGTEDIPALVARGMHQASNVKMPWEQLSPRAHKLAADRAKKLLNTAAVSKMTPERLAERDPQGELISWLRAIAELAKRE